MVCLLFHKWEGCKCSKCGKLRDQDHNWDGCICFVCGKERYINHNWDGCICSGCGIKRDQDHILLGCRCIKCKTEIHLKLWNECICLECGKLIKDEEVVISSIQKSKVISDIPNEVFELLVDNVLQRGIELKIVLLGEVAMELPKSHQTFKHINLKLNDILTSEKKMLEHQDYFAAASESVNYISTILTKLESKIDSQAGSKCEVCPFCFMPVADGLRTCEEEECIEQASKLFRM
ncbi:MAG: hypothetical protein KJ630_17225 [Proteobacteria bacterium]|nr:hypothetical protein [Pseudomonadota bacterium]